MKASHPTYIAVYLRDDYIDDCDQTMIPSHAWTNIADYCGDDDESDLSEDDSTVHQEETDDGTHGGRDRSVSRDSAYSTVHDDDTMHDSDSDSDDDNDEVTC